MDADADARNPARSGLGGTRWIDELETTGVLAGRQVRPAPFRRLVLRPEDLLVLELEFVNLRLDAGVLGARLVRIDSSRPAYLVAHLPPQSFAEQSFFEKEDDPDALSALEKKVYLNAVDDELTGPPVLARISGPSRLGFRMPDNLDGLDYTLAATLEACRTWEPSVAPVALPAPEHDPAAIEGQQVLRHHLAGISSALIEEAAELATTHVARALRHQLAAPLEIELERLGVPRSSARAALDAAVEAATLEASVEIAERASGLVDQPAVREVLLRGVGRVVDGVGRPLGAPGGLLGVIPGLALYLTPTRPARTATAIELPYRLVISPSIHARWVHETDPIEHDGRTELWHTRLGTLDEGVVTEREHRQRAIRTIWSPDYLPDPEGDPKTWGLPEPPWPGGVWQSLLAKNRHELVHLTSNHALVDTTTKPDTVYTPTPAKVSRLMLSALGGWLDAEGAWPHKPDALLDLLAWRHLAALGRDNYVRVVETGVCYPPRHGAVRVTVTERRFHNRGGRRVAYLRTQQFVIVRQRVVTYPGLDTRAGRRFPFAQVEALTLVTPNLDPTREEPSAVLDSAWSPGDVFWPRVGGELFPFRFVATDHAGRAVPLTIPVLFVMGSVAIAGKQADIDKVVAAYGHGTPWAVDDADAFARRTASTQGRTVRYAESAKPGDTDIETESITFTGEYAAGPPRTPSFRPLFDQASVRIPAVQRLLGDDEAVAVSFPKVYADDGVGGGNKGQVFLQTVDAKEVEFAKNGKGAAVGGLISPDFSLAGLSRAVGPVGGSSVDKVVAANFQPSDFFPDATLFGGISLSDVLDQSIPIDVSAPSASAPTLTFEEIPGGTRTTYRWTTTKFAKHDQLVAQPGAELSIETTIETGPGGQSKVETDASLTKFDVNLFGFVTIPFDEVRFHAPPGKKPEVDVLLRGPVKFGGPLEFVNTLREFIPSDGFADPPDLAVTDAGIAASYDVELPAIQVGVFSLENVALGAGFELPFDARKMTVRFNFAERHETFTITVSAFGGGGFLALELNADGPVAIEGALEFGGKLALNIGVASGGVWVKAGIYFSWAIDQTTKEEAVLLSGYVEMGGELSVIGLIHVSIVFFLSLTYTDNGKVWGQATVYVEVEVAFISETVELTVEKQFTGSEGDPTFAELMPEQEMWDAYCDCFAVEAG